MTFEQFQNKLDQAIKRISRTQWTYFGVAVGVLAIAIVAYNLNNNTPTDQLADNGMPGMHAMIDHKGLTTNPRIPVNPGKPDQPPHRFIPDPNLYGYGYGYGYWYGYGYGYGYITPGHPGHPPYFYLLKPYIKISKAIYLEFKDIYTSIKIMPKLAKDAITKLFDTKTKAQMTKDIIKEQLKK